MYLINYEEPTNELRYNTMGNRTNPVLEQKWQCRNRNGSYHEWRPVPSVEEPKLVQYRDNKGSEVTCD